MNLSVVKHTASLKESVSAMLSAHQDIADGIADHAERHTREMDAARDDLKRQRAIQDGIRRSSSGV